MIDKGLPPWTDEQVMSANAYQQSGLYHPFTCVNRDDGQHVQRKNADLGELVARQDGWFCLDCDYTQDWAHPSMLDWTWKGPIDDG